MKQDAFTSAEPAPIFKPISFAEASKFSPWIDRILGFDTWQKTQREPSDILKEYNEGWYGPLFEAWREHFKSGPTCPLSFFHKVIKEEANETERNFAVYRTKQKEALFSAGDSLAVGDLVLVVELFRLMVVRFVEELALRFGATGIAEAGCGGGINLFFINSLLGLKPFVGGEICSNAIKVGNAICEDLKLPGHFRKFDYTDASSLQQLVEGLENYMLLTCHSIEQVQVRSTSFLDSILRLKNKPSIVVHIEPLQWKEDSFFARLCQRYSEINRYNQDFVELLTEQHALGSIEIVETRKRCFGISAFNPSSFVAWRPV